MSSYTCNDLLRSTQQFASWRGPGYANSEGMTFMECIPYKQMKTVVYHWRHKPSPIKRNKDGSLPKGASKPNYYDVFLEFQQVQFGEEGDEIPLDNTWDKREYKGNTFFFEKPSIDRNPVRVKCTCADYHFRCSYSNYSIGLHYGGTYHHYSRKTPLPPEGRPYANPEKIPMMCKHVYNSIVRSITEGMILGGR